MLGWLSQKEKIKYLEVSGIPITIKWKWIKYLRLTIKPFTDSSESPKVVVSAPWSVRTTTILDFIDSKKNWIKKKLDKAYQMHQDYKDSDLGIPSKIHWFLGNPYFLQVNDFSSNQKLTNKKKYIDSKKSVQIEGQNLILSGRNLYTEKNRKLLDQWYREKIIEFVSCFIDKWETVMGVKVREYRIKKMKTRWGTCNVKDKRIWINLILIQKSLSCLEYVVVHEMVHLLERSHNQRFYRLMDKFLPHWKLIKNQLNKIN